MIIPTWSWADYILISIVALSILVSLARGFVREALSLVTWAAALWVAFTFSSTLASLLTGYFKTPSIRLIVGFAVLFIITLMAGAFINYLISQLIDKTGLTGTDRMLGILFGMVRGVLLVTILIMMARLTPLSQDPWWKESYFIPYFKPMELWIHSLLPASVTDHLKLLY